MPSTTRSSIRFPSSKQAVGPAKSSAPTSSSSSKPDAITLLFRREVQSLLSTAPALPSHIPADTPVEVVACVERLSLSGIQQSVQLCQAGDETWVTRTEGARHYFPRAGRVQKRLRGTEEENEDEQEGARGHEMDEEVAARGKKSKKSHSRRRAQEYETPNITSSSTPRRPSPAAPLKKKKHHRSRRVREEREEGEEGPAGGEDFDDGASTETEGSHLARTRGPRNPGMLISIGEENIQAAQLGRGQRRCAGRNTTPQARNSTTTEEGVGYNIKSEEADDLASLCGRVDGLEFRSTVDPDSEYERTPAPVPNVKGKGRA
ncbi:hypothetical protein JCM3765_005660 [Sporobolomyces pararoseus]